MPSRPLIVQSVGFMPQTPTSGILTQAIASTSARLAFGIVPRYAKFFLKFKIYLNALQAAFGTYATTDYFMDIFSDGIGAAAGAPGATMTSGAGATLTSLPTGPGWVEWTGTWNAGAGISLSADHQYWVVLSNANANAATTNSMTYQFGGLNTGISASQSSDNAFGWSKVFASTGSNWGASTNCSSGWRVGYADGSYAGIPVQAIGASADQVLTSNEAGIKFTTPPNVQLNVAGAQFLVSRAGTIASTGQLFYKLYQGTSLVTGGSTNALVTAGNVTTGASVITLNFPSVLTLAPSTLYRLTFSQGAGGSAGNYYFNPAEYTIDSDANSEALFNIFQSACSKTFFNGSTFTDTATAIHPFLLILDSEGGEFSSSGGVLYLGGMEGGMQS